MFLTIKQYLHFKLCAYAKLNYLKLDCFLRLNLYLHKTNLFNIEQS